MKRKILQCLPVFLFSLFFSINETHGQCPPAAAQTDLDLNGVSSRLLAGGGLWWDLSAGRYIVPKGGQTASLFAGSLWMGGYDSGGVLHLAGQTYGASSGNLDYWSGPLADDGTTTDANCNNWDKFFVVSREEINDHQSDWLDGTIDGPVPNSILGWPGNGNPNFFDANGFEILESATGLAPFHDWNENGIYEPMMGDFPLAKGDQSIWWVYNDEGGGALHNETQGITVQMEVQVNAFSFDPDNEPDAEFTTFYDYRLVYKGSETLSDFYVSLWVDPDLGCWSDDYIGCLPDEDLGFIYNSDDLDENCSGLTGYGSDIPVLGIKVLEPYTPGASTPTGLSKFMFFNNASQGSPPPATTDPNIAPEFHNLMQGIWKDGVPLSQGGTGYDPAVNDPYDFAYDGNPSDDSQWSECSANSPTGDRRFLMSFGPFDLNPGDIGHLSFAVVWIPAQAHPCPDVSELVDAANDMKELYEAHCQDILTSTSQWAEPGTVSLSPNPASGEIFVESTVPGLELESAQLYNATGSLVKSTGPISSPKQNIGVHDFPDGIYFYRIKLSDGKMAAGRFVVKKY